MPKIETKTMRLNPHGYFDNRKLAKMLEDGWEITSQSKPPFTTTITYVFTRPKKSLLERLADTNTSGASE